MPRFQMDDRLYDDPAVIRAGTAAFGLYARCGDYVAGQLLDGFVPSEVAVQWGTAEWIRKLTGAGLWETVPGGFNMPRYLDDNPSREKVLAERKLKAERQQRWLDRQRSARSRPRRVSRPSNGPSNDAPGDGQKDIALPPSLTGRKAGAGANGAHAPPAPLHSQTAAEAILAAGLTPNHQPARGETVHALAAQARQAITKQETP